MGIERLGEIWPEWQLVEEDSVNQTYIVEKNNKGISSYAAIKILSIPSSTAEKDDLLSKNLNETDLKEHLQKNLTALVNELEKIKSMTNVKNIVRIDDYKAIEKSEELGWDIFIRTELLTSLVDYTANKKLSEQDVAKLGQDICTVLDFYASQGIIHGDISPENIFISNAGDFKLRDFGLARVFERNQTNEAFNSLLAPEVLISNQFDSTSDIYSTGLLLYSLLNNNRLPFIDTNSPVISYQNKKTAFERRLNGEALPPPAEASSKMEKAVLTACSFYPEKRFKTAFAFKAALGEVIREKSKAFSPNIPNINQNKQMPHNLPSQGSVHPPVQQGPYTPARGGFNNPYANQNAAFAPKKKDNNTVLWVLMPILILILAGLVFLLFRLGIVKDVLVRIGINEETEYETTDMETETISETTTEETTEESTTEEITTTTTRAPQAQQQPPPLVPATYYRVVTNDAVLLIRDGPTTSANIIGRMPKGAIVPVTSYYGNWGYVQYSGVKGWSSLDYLEMMDYY